MAGTFDYQMLQQSDQQGQPQDDPNYHPDGSGKFNDHIPPPVWEPSAPVQPPNPAAGSEVLVHRDRLMAVAKNMQQDLDKLKSILDSYRMDGLRGVALSGWPTANAFGTNAGNAFSGISMFYDALNTVYEQAINNINKAVGNYTDAESTTQGAVQSIPSKSGGGSLTPQ